MMSVTVKEGRTTRSVPISPDQLPVELYFKIGFDEHATAAKWCAEVQALLKTIQLGELDGGLQRFALWGPQAPEPNGWTTGGYGYAFVSELTLRVVRAFGRIRVPGAEAVSLSELPYDLHMYMGSEADSRAYKAIRSN
jgi:hypothetical protein